MTSRDSLLNPFAAELLKLREEIKELETQKRSVEEEIRWFDETDRDVLCRRLEDAQCLAQSLEKQVQTKDAEITAVQREIRDVSSAIGTWLNPANWFDPDQRALRRTRRQLTETLQDLRAVRAKLAKRLATARSEIEATRETIARYDSFDIESRRRLQRDLSERLLRTRPECDRVEARYEKVEVKLNPIREQLHCIKKKIEETSKMLDLARYFEDELCRARNSYQRAVTHKECESWFGVRSPRRVIAEKEREIKRLERDYQKTIRRAAEIAEKASRDIRTLVLDGNNLCYEGGRFIGLTALAALVQILVADYSVIVVFDASIRRKLGQDDRAIRQSLSSYVKVHIVASKQRADETILDLAEDDRTIYVLSNDRFGEFYDKRVVQEGRLIRHEIIGNRIIVRDLDIDTTFDRASRWGSRGPGHGVEWHGAGRDWNCNGGTG